MRRLLPLLVLLGCKPAEDSDSSGTLPPEDSAPADSGTATFTVDTGLGNDTYDDVPAHVLDLRHSGFWVMTPLGGPYRALTGELEVWEFLDGDQENPACYLRYALTGTADTDGCPGCGFTFLVSNYLAEGDPSTCLEPELPGEQEHQGFADPTIYEDYQQTGIWLPWYDATYADDEVDFTWESSVGVDVKEDGT